MLLVLLVVFVAKMGRVEFMGIRVPEARLTMPGTSLHKYISNMVSPSGSSDKWEISTLNLRDLQPINQSLNISLINPVLCADLYCR